MPRHPPYTLSNLITFIDHRHTGRVQRRVRQQPGHTVNNVSSIAKKVLGDIRPTEKPGPQKDLVAIRYPGGLRPDLKDGHRGLFKFTLTNKP